MGINVTRRHRTVIRGIAVLLIAWLAVSPLHASLVFGQTGFTDPSAENDQALLQPRQLVVSTSEDRSGAVPLSQSAPASGNVYVFIDPPQGIKSVKFFLNPSEAELEAGLMDAKPFSVSTTPPFDFSGNAGDGKAKALNASSLPNRIHTLAALIEHDDGRLEVIKAELPVHHGSRALKFAKSNVRFTIPQGTRAWETVNLWTTDRVPAKAKISKNADWLKVQEPVVQDEPGTVVAPETQVLEVDSTGLEPGTYTARLSATSEGLQSDSMIVTMTVVGSTCTPVPCSDVKVDLPHVMDFSQDHGYILDGNNVGTGFTWIDQPSKSTGYIPENLHVDTSGSGTLNITTTAGSAYQQANTQDNALGVGIAAPNQVSIFETTIVNPPPGEMKFEQAGLWFGNDEDNYAKLAIISMPAGGKLVNRVQFLIEEGGVELAKIYSLHLPFPVESLYLRLRVDPSDMTLTAYYSQNGGALKTLGQFVAAPEFFSFDAAGINPEIGTRSFGGVYTQHRGAPAPVVYEFDSFSVSAETTPPPPPDTDFTRAVFAASFPTSMVWGPDGRLYILEMSGRIRAVTLDPQTKAVIGTQLIEVLGSRMALGITVDPLSTPENVILWVSHSSPALFSGEFNSSMVTRLSGPGFATRQDVITGLPRAFANHSTNSIHFGPDGRLYIAQGGNTGAGAPNTDNTEFGTRAEQPLSAALLVADVNNASFNGNCAAPEGTFAPAPCDVQTFATGMRNMYDFTFHTNGYIYGPDNGLGVSGSYPPKPTPPCTGFGSTAPWNEGGNNPGPQPDILLKIEQGFYYGHPNPYRNECVFKNGTYQKTSALPNYQTPIYTLGSHTSSNGTIEYKGNAFNGELRGQLLIVNYSAGDDITRIKLSADGRSVLEKRQLAGSFNDPLAITEGPDGTIYVAEFGGGKITALIPKSDGEIDTTPPVPPTGLTATASEAGITLDWADNTDADFNGYRLYRSDSIDGPFTQLNTQLLTTSNFFDPNAPVGATSFYYVTSVDLVGNESDPSTIVSATRPNTGTWTVKQSAPVALLDPGGAALDGKLYVFGGKTGSGPVKTLHIYDPASDTWSTGADLPAEYPAVEDIRGVGYNGKLYVFGGAAQAFQGATASAAVYDPATDTWTMLPPMVTARSGAVVQVLGDLIYVAGGMGGDGASLNSVEVFDPAQNSWGSAPSMLTRRDNPGSAVLDGRLYVFGGRTRAADGSGPGELNTVEMFDPATQEWTTRTSMPTGRRVAVVGLLNGKAQVMGGERQPDGSTFPQNEEYDPATDTWRTLTPMRTPRHGAAAGTIDGVVYVVMGGTIGGSSFSDINEAFQLSDEPVPNVPATPTGLVAVASESGINLDWNDNTETDLSGYNVYRSSSASGPFTKLNGVLLTASSYNDTAAPAGVESFYRVTAVNPGGESAPATVSATRTSSTSLPPAQPTGLSASPGTGGIALDWDDNLETDLTGYNVYRSSSATGPFNKLNGALLTGSSYNDTSAPVDVESFYRVTAVNNAGESTPATISATRPSQGAAVLLPATIQVEDYRAGGPNVGYVDTTAGNTGAQYRTDDVDIQQCSDPTTPAGETCYNVGWIAAGEWLAYDVEVATSGDYTFTVRYATPNNGRSLHVELDGANITGAINLARTGGWQTWQSVTTNAISLEAGTYTLKVVADTGDFNVNALTVSTATPPDTTPPATPAGLAASGDESGITLNWNANSESDLAGYNVYRGSNAAGPFTLLTATPLSSPGYQDTAAPIGSTSYYQVTAVDTSDNESDPATAQADRPGDPPPAQPTGLSANPSTGGIALDWNDNAETDLTGYNVYHSTSATGPFTRLNGSLLAGSSYNDTAAPTDVESFYRVTAVNAAGESSPATISAIRPSQPTSGTVLPATIQFEDYASGGQGVGYFDTTAGNAGGQYRSDDVDIQQCSDPNMPSGITCYNVGWVDQGEWLAYPVTVETTGEYTFTVRYATANSGRHMHFELDGANISGQINLTRTGGWQTWRSVTTGAISLEAGTYILKMVADTGGFNLNEVNVSAVMSVGIDLPGTIQVEDYKLGGPNVGYFDSTAGNSGGKYRTDDVDIQQCSDPTTAAGQTCYNVGWTDAGEWLAYDVNVATSGQHTFTVRYATPSNGRKVHIEVDGVNVTGSINLPNTGGYQVWGEVTTPAVALEAGNHTIRLVIETSGVNLNYITVTQSGG